jgi:putative sugar O-methyltransferase
VKKKDKINILLEEYNKAPSEYRVANYWANYETQLINLIEDLDLSQMRSGKYPILSTFGFIDGAYTFHPRLSFWKKLIIRFLRHYIIKNRAILPYKLRKSDIEEMAYRHCELMCEVTSSVPISTIEVSEFGNPPDLFEINGSKYTVPFLSYYRRYCFAHNHMSLKGDEVIVELGSGSGYQIEILKKLYPNLTILCFDIPLQLYLCEEYLTNVLGEHNIVGIENCLKWNNLSNIKKGSVHFLGSWQVPLLKDFQFDVFWNAASFGEMEPDIVQNYLKYIKGNAKWIYLLQARHGKETVGEISVNNAITFEDYNNFLSGYKILAENDAWHSHKRLSQSGGYFEGVWAEVQ